MKRKKLLQIFVLCSLTLGSQVPALTATPTEEKKSRLSTDGIAPVRVISNNDWAYSFQVDGGKPGVLPASGTLLSIDAVPLKGKSERAIYKMLEGEIDSPVEISYLDSAFNLKTVKVQREKKKKSGVQVLKNLDSTMRILDYERNMWTGDDRRARDAEVENLGLLTRAYSKFSVASAEELPGPKSYVVGRYAAEAVIDCDMVGAIDDADRYLQVVIKNPEFEWLFGSLRQSDAEMLVEHLRMTGRLKEAEFLCRKFLEVGERDLKKPNPSRQTLQGQLTIKEMLAKVLAAEHKNKEALEIASQLFKEIDDLRVEYWRINYSQRWLPELLEQLGDDVKASKCYEHWVHAYELKDNSNENEHPGLQRVGEYCSAAYHLAVLQSKLQKSDEAITTLKTALDRYNAYLRPDEQNYAEQLDGYFPDGSDIETKLAQIYLEKNDFESARAVAQSAVARIEKVVGTKSSVLRDSLEALASAQDGLNQSAAANESRARLGSLELQATYDEPDYSTQFALLREALNAADRRDVASAKRAVDKLVSIYDQQDAIHDFHRRPLNLFCALQELARHLADHEQFAESNSLLTKIRLIAEAKEFTPSAYTFVDAEQSLNQTHQKRELKSAVFPLTFSAEQAVSRMVSSDAISSTTGRLLGHDLDEVENFRALSVIYGDAGEHSRANILLDRALSAFDWAQQKSRESGDVGSSLLAHVRIILLLDAARISCQANRLEDANKFAKQSIALCSVTPPYSSDNDNRSFNDEYAFKIAELAGTFRNAGESVPKVVQFLTEARDKLASGATADAAREKRVARSFGGYYALVDSLLAKMLFADKQNARALPVVRNAIEECGNNVPASLRYLAGQIFEANALFAEAAHHYVEGAEFASIVQSGLYNNAMQTLALKRAASCADRGMSSNKAETANIYLRLSQQFEQNSPGEALVLVEKASALISDSDPGKARLPIRIANLKQRIIEQENEANKQNSTAGSVTNKTKNSSAPRTPVETHAIQVAESKTRVDAERQAAAIDEKNGRPEAARKYFQLAETEAYAEMPKESIADARHSLRLHHRTHDSLGYEQGMLGSSSDLYETCRFANQLAKSGHAKDGEDFCREVIQVTERDFGSRSSAVAFQDAQLFEFYIEQRREAEALQLLDSLLTFDLRVLEVGGPMKKIMDCGDSLARDKRPELALKIFSRVLNAQRKFFDSDDQRIAETLVSVAKAQDSLNDTAAAEKTMLESASIYRKYVGDERLAIPCHFLIDVWKKMGRTDDAKLVSVNYMWVSPALLRRYGKSELAAQLEKTGKLPADFVDAEHPQENRVMYQRAQIALTPPEVYEHEYNEACVETPYSRRASAALEILTSKTIKLKDWQRSVEFLKPLIKIQEHTPDPTAGRSWGCVPPTRRRLDAYNDLVMALTQLGKFEEAQSWIDRAEKNLPDLTCLEYATLADRELELPNQERARNYAELAEKTYTDQYFAVLPQRMAKLWKELGQPERAGELKKRADAYYQKSQEQTKQAQTSPFKYVR